MLAAQRTNGRRFLSFIVFSLLVHASNANALRKSSVPERSLEESLVCELAILDVQFENQDGREIYQCLPSQSGFGDLAAANDQNGYGNLAYTIDLPSDFFDKHKNCKGKEYGSCMISVPDGKFLFDDDDEPFVFIPDISTIAVAGSGSRQRRLSVTGHHETLVVRVTINDDGPDPSTTDLAGSVFGLGDNPAEQSMAGQYSACSFGQLQFLPAEGETILNGVMSIEILKEGGTLSILSLLSDLLDAVEDKMPNNIDPDHIMFVVPYGTEFQGYEDWVAFAHVGGYSSVYNNIWGDSLSSQMHEIGHNLGFHHSSEGSVQYGDTTGMMGYSYRQRGGPLMCFNGFKSYVLGWYSDKTEVVNPWANDPWTGQLAAFVDYGNNAAKTVLIKVGNAHVMFNREKGMNSGTDEKPDLVTVTEGTEAGLQSYNLGGLAVGQSVEVYGAVIEICNVVISHNEGMVDYATHLPAYISAYASTFTTDATSVIVDLIAHAIADVTVHAKHDSATADAISQASSVALLTVVSPTPPQTPPPTPSPTPRPTPVPTPIPMC